MEGSLRPHRGGVVLGLGIVGLLSAFLLLPIGIVAWVLGSKELSGMDEGRIDPGGRVTAQVGRVFGIVGTFLPVPVACVAFVVLGFLRGNVTTIIDSRHPDVQLVQTTYATNSRGSEQKAKESEYRELRQADGTWLRDGLYVHWSPTGRKLEEGSYTLGMRTGPWTFWNEDSSVDHVKSGVYENDVKVRD